MQCAWQWSSEGPANANRNAASAIDIKWLAASLHSSSQDNLALLFGKLVSRRRNGVSEVWHSRISKSFYGCDDEHCCTILFIIPLSPNWK